jgi:2'-5' RNA ligase
MSSPPDAALQRLFFALWPSRELGTTLAGLARRHSPSAARRLPAADLHITLAFVGAVDAATRACLEQAATKLRGEAFDLSLDRIGAWPGPRILWLAPSAPPPALLQLARDLQQALRSCGYQPEARPYRPHVTLARKLAGEPPATAVPPLHWPVRDFVLAESLSGPAGLGYRVLARWPLGIGNTPLSGDS